MFVALSGPIVPRLWRSAVVGAFLDGLNVASLALMAVVTWQPAQGALTDWPTVLLVRFRINSAWLVGAGALVGSLRTLLV